MGSRDGSLLDVEPPIYGGVMGFVRGVLKAFRVLSGFATLFGFYRSVQSVNPKFYELRVDVLYEKARNVFCKQRG